MKRRSDEKKMKKMKMNKIVNMNEKKKWNIWKEKWKSNEEESENENDDEKKMKMKKEMKYSENIK